MTGSRTFERLAPLLDAIAHPALLLDAAGNVRAANRAGSLFVERGARGRIGGVSLRALAMRVGAGRDVRVVEPDPLAVPPGSRQVVADSVLAPGRSPAVLVTVEPAEMLADARRAATSRLLPGVAHELRSPLTTISGVAQVLALEPGLAGGAREALELVRAQVARADALLRNLVAFARGPRGTGDFPVPLADAVQRALELVAHDLRVGRVETEVAYGAELPLVAADPEELVLLCAELLAAALASCEGAVKSAIALRTVAGAGRTADFEVGVNVEGAKERDSGRDTAFLDTVSRGALRLGGNLAVVPTDAGWRARLELPGWAEEAAPAAPPRALVAMSERRPAMAALRRLEAAGWTVTLTDEGDLIGPALVAGGISAALLEAGLLPERWDAPLPAAAVILARRGQRAAARELARRLGRPLVAAARAVPHLLRLAGAGPRPRLAR